MPRRAGKDEFTAADYRNLYERLMAASDDDVTAILSNNFNVVLGAMLVAAPALEAEAAPSPAQGADGDHLVEQIGVFKARAEAAEKRAAALEEASTMPLNTAAMKDKAIIEAAARAYCRVANIPQDRWHVATERVEAVLAVVQPRIEAAERERCATIARLESQRWHVDG